MHSVTQSWALCLGMVFFAVAVAYAYVQLLKSCAGIAAWSGLLAIQAALALSAGVLWQSAQQLKDAPPDLPADSYKSDVNWQMRFGGSIVFMILAVLFLCFILFMRKRIALAVRMIKLVRLIRASKIYERWQARVSLSFAALQIIKCVPPRAHPHENAKWKHRVLGWVGYALEFCRAL